MSQRRRRYYLRRRKILAAVGRTYHSTFGELLCTFKDEMEINILSSPVIVTSFCELGGPMIFFLQWRVIKYARTESVQRQLTKNDVEGIARQASKEQQHGVSRTVGKS